MISMKSFDVFSDGFLEEHMEKVNHVNDFLHVIVLELEDASFMMFCNKRRLDKFHKTNLRLGKTCWCDVQLVNVRYVANGGVEH